MSIAKQINICRKFKILQPIKRSMSACGYCLKCNTMHTLPTTQHAKDQVNLLRLSLHSNIPPFTIERRGKMVGVLITKDLNGEERVLKAFAGAVNGKWGLDGWSPVVGGEGTSPNDLPKYLKIQSLQYKLHEEQNHLKIKIKKMQFEKEKTNDYALQKTLLELDELVSYRRKLAISALDEIRQHQYVTNFRGETDLLQNVFATSQEQDWKSMNSKRIAMPSGTGDCCATKLLADAARQNLHPISIAEIFIGDTSTKNEGEFYDACKERCQPVLGFMLCGIEEQK